MTYVSKPSTSDKHPATSSNHPGTVSAHPGTGAGNHPVGGLSPPAAPTMTAPVNMGGNVFNGVSVTVSATTSDTPDRIDFVLDPSGAATIVATDSSAPFSQSWTPTGVSLGSHTLVARAVNGAGSTDSAPITILVGEVIHTLVSSVTCLRGWQFDFGLTLGGTPLASGTSPPAITFTGSIASTASTAVRIECQTTGALGASTIRYGAYNTGSASVTWIEQNVTTAATINCIGELSGLVLNLPAGTYTNDNVYQGTCASATDQKNSTTAVQAVAGKQPLILWDSTANRLFLRFDGTDDTLVEGTLDLPPPATTNTYVEAAFVQRTWTSNKSLFSATAGNMQCVGQTATPQLKLFNASFSAGVGATLGALVRGEFLFTGSTSDRIKIAATSGTGTSAGNNNAAAGFNIGSGAAANFGAMDIYNLMVFAGQPSAGERTTLDTTFSSMYSGIGV